MRLIAYNMRQGGSRDTALWARLLSELAPDVFFVQESRDPTHSWLPALETNRVTPTTQGGQHASCLWTVVPGGRWGTGIWVRDGTLTPLEVPDVYSGRVVAAVVEGCAWPHIGMSPVLALSIHGPTRKGSSYIREIGYILDFARDFAAGLPLVLGGDFNVAVGLREDGQTLSISRGERLLLGRLREELGLVPCWQTAHPGEPLARTLRWMHRIDSPPYHCDGLFVPAEWAPALQSCEVQEGEEWIALGDHNPVVADFRLHPL